MRQGLRTTPRPKTILDPETIQALVEARHGDPFAVLGPHRAAGKEVVIRVLLPGAVTVEAIKESGKPLLALGSVHPGGLFEGMLKGVKELPAYRLRVDWGSGVHELDDPYRFGPVLGPMDDYLLGEGTHRRLYDKLGAHLIEHEGASGVHFAVWAPDASRVAVVGDFNGWDGRRHGLRRRVDTGVWEIFIPGLGEGAAYKYEIKARDGSMLPLKADPLAFAAEFRPNTASIVRQTKGFVWNDAAWLEARSRAAARDAPVSIYEVHLGSWRRDAENRYLSYDELADTLLPYVKEMGFSHLELLPINEYPFDGSWGYQPIGLYAPTSRFGDPQAFVRFVDRAHALGLGIILDWVPGHFPTDPHGLARFDGTALYEHLDPRQGFHHDWNTFIYNFGRPEVANFLHANALFWLERYHVDGLRVDAVASMLYLDYSRPADEWVPNVHGGRENLETIAFLRRLNELTYGEAPGSVTIAEESTSWPGVSRPPYAGGLGFGYKWNMGWMNDTLDYMGRDPIHRRHHHHQLTFGLAYAWSENFVLPLSHDEVVHGKRSILGRMPGDPWQQFANLRAYYAFMWAHPGKKLLFMGQEFGQGAEWNYDRGLDWHLLDTPWHAGVQALVRQLNELYRTIPALHRKDCEPQGFAWVEADDYQRSIYSFLRLGNADDPPVLVVCNFTPQPRFDERFGVPHPGLWRERLNTDAEVYGGSNVGNQGEVTADEVAWHGRPYSLRLAVPPLGVVYLEWAGSSAEPA